MVNIGKLYIVGTPIGNLQDITLRAIETLKKTKTIACEDTRITRKLLSFFKIEGKKLLQHQDKNERRSTKGLIQLLLQGEDIALVSDAGMPGISDPGFYLIRECYKNDIKVVIIPGVSASTTAFVWSNLGSTFTFLGFLSPKKGTRKNLLQKLEKGVYVIYAPRHSILQILEDINQAIGNQAKVFVARELTKIHETSYSGSIEEIAKALETELKGEFVLVLKKS